MPVHLTLTLDRVYLRAGVAGQTFSAAGQFRPARPWDRLAQFGVLIFWPRSVGWLRLSGTAGPDPAAGPPAPLADTPAGLDAVCAAHAVRREQVAPPKFLEAHAFLVASLPQHNRVHLRVEVDTDDDDFRKAVRERRDAAKGELVQPIRLLFFDAKQFGNYVDQGGAVDLVLKPCAPVPRFPGVVAVDLGNTTTTAASLAETDPVYRTESVKFVPLDPAAPAGGRPEPMPSVVRLDQINTVGEVPAGTRRFPVVPEDDRPQAVAYVAGGWAAAGAADGELPPGVVYGAKQLLTVKDPPGVESHFAVTLPHARPGEPPQTERVEVLDRLPGELLFTHAVRQFRRHATAWPPDLALTYPTTYGPRELRQLARAAARGWLRAMNQPQGFDRPEQPGEDPELERQAVEVRQWLHAPPDPAAGPADCPVVGLTLDEATAAAFFHVYRRVFERPGGLVRFRYLHPDGLRLLLIDCGGGTTDVSLVHAVSPPDTPNLLVVDVLARTGVRAFGGDDITRAACRVLKAKLALLAARVRRPAEVPAGLQPLPAIGPAAADAARSAVEDFIGKVAKLDPADELVPTKFDPANPDATFGPRKTAAHGLWQLGERVKRKLGDGKPVRLKDLGPDAVGRESSPVVAAALRPLPLQAQSQLLAQIGELTVAPWEVDALIRRPVAAVVDKCNRLIRRKLTDAPGGREQEVEWVVLSGNGARYPLVKKVVTEHLHVAYLDERLTVDDQNLKDAVAKGAAMARMVERVPRAAGIKFNRDLSKLLPFDVGYHDLVMNTTKPLFAEYTPYRELAERTARVKLFTTGGASGAGDTFILERRFPGDDGYAPYGAYHFAQGIRGELEVRYDPDAGEFAVTDTVTGELGAFKDLTDAEHRVAVLRGDL